MAAAVANIADGFFLFGSLPVQEANITGDASYPTGGYALTGALFGLGATGGGTANVGIHGITVIGQNTAASTYTAVWITSTGKLMILQAGVEVTAATNLSTLTFKVLVYAASE